MAIYSEGRIVRIYGINARKSRIVSFHFQDLNSRRAIKVRLL